MFTLDFIKDASLQLSWCLIGCKKFSCLFLTFLTYKTFCFHFVTYCIHSSLVHCAYITYITTKKTYWVSRQTNTRLWEMMMVTREEEGCVKMLGVWMMEEKKNPHWAPRGSRAQTSEFQYASFHSLLLLSSPPTSDQVSRKEGLSEWLLSLLSSSGKLTAT